MIFLAQYPIGWIMHYCIRGTTVRHLYTTIIGILFQLYVYRGEVKHVIFMTAVAYLLMSTLPRQSQAGYVMAWVLAYLSYQHICSLLYSYGDYKMDITAYTMLLVCKLSALAFCYKDGGEKNPEILTPYQNAMAVEELPSVFEIISYVFYSQACALGVFFEFAEYKRFIEETV